MPTALGDLRVLDLAGPSGWYCAKLLADLGADVLRLEPADGGIGRKRAPFDGDVAGPNNSLAYRHFNTSKRARTADLSSAGGRATFFELAAGADVIVETEAPGGLAGLGIRYEELARTNPGLIWTSITPFGLWGPRSNWKGTDIVGAAMGGLMNLAGVPGSPPSQPGGEAGYHQGGVLGAVGTLMAVAERDKSGVGQLVEVSMQESMIVTNENNLGYLDSMGITRRRIGRKTFGGTVTIYRTSDGWMIGWPGRRWEQFLSWVDELGLVPDHWRDPEWSDEAYRFAHAQEIDDVMFSVMAKLPRETVYLESQKRRIANGPVVSIDELFKDPQLAGREFWVDLVDPESGRTHRYAGAPYKLSKTPWRISREAPALGEHDGEGWLREKAELPPVNKPEIIPDTSPSTIGSYWKANKSGSGALAGIRVIDFTWQIAGPLTTQLLADHGADVIKVESLIHPDGLRVMAVPRPPWEDSPNQSGIFNSFNSSKRSITIDLRTAKGVEILKELIATADVTVDNYGVDPFPKWGLSYDSMKKINKNIIVARSSVMGRSGPRAQFIGFGYSISAAAGLNSQTGFPGDPPIGACVALPDYGSNPNHLMIAILAALHFRKQTGEGQYIDLSQHESTVVFNGPALLEYSVNGRVVGRRKNRHEQIAPHGAYQARGEDKWIVIACDTEKSWKALCSAMDRDELGDDPRFLTAVDRKDNEDALDAEITLWTRRHDSFDAVETLQAAGIPAGVVQSSADLERDPHLTEREQILRIAHPELGKTLLNTPGFRLTRTPGFLRRHSVIIGQDTDDILRDVLHMSEEDIAMGYVEAVLQ